MTRFSLDVDPGAVRSAGTALAALEAEVTAAAERLTAVLPQVQASWTGEAATALTGESTALVRHATDAATYFTDAGAAVDALAEVCQTAVDQDLPRLNDAWVEAGEQHAQAVAARRQQEQARSSALLGALLPTPGGGSTAPTATLPQVTAPSVEASDAALAATRRALEREFEHLRAELVRAAIRAGEELRAATVVPVTRGQAARYAAGGLFGDLFGLFGAGAGVFALQDDLPLTMLLQSQSRLLPPDSASLGELLDDARALDLPPAQYAKVLEAYWQARAFEAAGIDPADWDPSLGADHNRETIIAVYEYYGRVYRDNPAMQWAGLANLVGPGFAASFFDLDMVRDAAGALAHLPDLPGDVAGPLRELAGASDAQLAFYERTFLTMQKDIFTDMGAMHEAYLDGPGGLARIQEMRDAKLIDAETMRTWESIDRGRSTGDQRLLNQGAEGLARREQFDIIGDNWDAMRNHPPFGDAVTYVFTAVGRPSVPGTHFPGEVSPLDVAVTPERLPVLDPRDLPFVPNLPGLPFVDLPDEVVLPAQVKVRTSLPDFNVADRNARWDYFTADTLPAYVDLLDDGRVADMTAGDMQERIDRERSLRRVPEILAQHNPLDWRPVLE